MRTKAHFITARIFGEPFKVIKIDKAAVEYYTRLTAILRTYIEKRYGFNAMEMTSTEIIDRLLKEQTSEVWTNCACCSRLPIWSNLPNIIH